MKPNKDQFLNLKKECKPNGIYTVCLRGIKQLNDYLVNFSYNDHQYIGFVHSFVYLKFSELNDNDCLDNYDENARTINSLFKIMIDYYPDFNKNEFITLAEINT
jgi:hypothetical protein